ncbi:Eco57I restriction-modification methylase domain-containing protein [Pseudomonas sp. SC3(2021)]|uniref:Eco57I restriction-modification methylase domain-containing protein n=1 Tax=Pseudomonas sp. SC3(2021) TaxID=2871493 RepID=UPI0021CA01BE|nr:N-6 DNA methylase [Pseudomonas sp. SC3(2021)]
MLQQVFNAIQAKRNRPWSNEEEVRLAWIGAIENALGVHFDAERAKRDGSYNNVIIEFKAPGLFNGSKNSAKFKEATEDRLLKYIVRAAIAQNINQDEYIGIAIDGEHVCFAQVVDNNIHTQHLLPFSPDTVGLVLDAIQNNYRRAVITENLIEDFGQGAPSAIALMQAMADALSDSLELSGNNKVKMLFEEWRTLYGQVADLSIEQHSAINASLRFVWNGSPRYKMAGRLFVIHSYNSLLIKLLAAEIVSAHGLSSKTSPAQEMAFLLSDDALIKSLATDIERGRIFSEAGIKGFVEEAIFSWYLDVCDNPTYKKLIINSLRGVLRKLVIYRTDRLERTRDVLRDFYQGLVPETLRKSLGEFYTPDWLVEHTLSSVNVNDWLKIRGLDPTCGSGSFVIEMIRRKRRLAEEAGMSASKTIEMLCESVWGFDLNPLAVQTARVNYLMEIADLLRVCKGEQIEIPILLADAIYSPARDPNENEDVISYQIGSQVARLDIRLPADLAFNRKRLDNVFELMGKSVEDNMAFEQAESVLIESELLSTQDAAAWRKPLKETYDQVLNLHRQNWNGIWFRIVRNFFWSATAGKFDLVCGNPPWVRWSKLPEAYRERVKPTCEQYSIFSNTKFHGGNELDISAMITYTAGDKWLKIGGKLAFVITQTVFQSPSSAGFRNFKINQTDWLSPLFVDDLQALKPFPDAANKTSVVVFEKGNVIPIYPVDYRVWQAGARGGRSIDPTLSLQDVLSRVSIQNMEAMPVGDTGSPWAILRPGRWEMLNKLSGESKWILGRKGITADLNGVYFVPIEDVSTNGLVQIRTRPEAGKKDIGNVKKVWIEPDLLFPLIKGARDFEACYFKPSQDLFTFVPNTGINRDDYKAATAAVNKLKKTRQYFESFEKILSERSTYRGRMPGAPYYAVYNVGDFTFKPWKVIWAEMSGRFSAAVAGNGSVPFKGDRPYVPDHKVYFVAFDNKQEAHFLCGLLNSLVVKEYVESHNISIQVGNIFKHMELPRFDNKNKAHLELAMLVEHAHQEHDGVKRLSLVAEISTNADNVLESWMAKR